MRITTIPVGLFEMNAYIVAEDNNPACLLIDPGDDPQKIIRFIEKHELEPRMIINTHNHIDHSRRVSDIQKHFNIPFYINEDDLPLLETLSRQGMYFGMDASEEPVVEGFLKDNEIVELDETSFKILHTPGHSPGSISIYTEGHVFVGDVLFRGSIGRTDLYGGNYKTLIQSIKEKLFTLPDDTMVYPGHGPKTTIGYEKENNPFLSGNN